MPETIQFHRAILSTSETGEAAALMSLGVDWADTTDPASGRVLPPITTIVDAAHPNGVTSYHLAGKSDTGLEAVNLRNAWKARKSDEDFDELLRQLEAATANTTLAKLVRQIKATFPLALMAYFHGYSDNRRRLIDLRTKGTKLRRFRKGETGFVLISDNASNATRAHCGLPTIPQPQPGKR